MAVELSDFPFKSHYPPHPELLTVKYSPEEYQTIGRVGHLADSLRLGEIGFEWYTALTRLVLKSVGW